MGYHVRIMNTNSGTPDKEKILFDIHKLETILVSKFGFRKGENKKDGVFFYHYKNEEFILFYEKGELLAITTNDMLINLMEEIAKFFNDGSVVVGDEEIDSSVKEKSLYSNISQKIIKFIVGISIPIIFSILAYIFKL